MGREIERKFLVGDECWRERAVSRHRLIDFIAPFGNGKVRLRLTEEKAWITVKGPRNGASRAEFEYEIPYDDAQAMLEALTSSPTVVKERYCVPEHGLTWSVDVHEEPNAGLVTAEVELESEDQPVTLPCWVGREITGLPIVIERPLFFVPG